MVQIPHREPNSGLLGVPQALAMAALRPASPSLSDAQDCCGVSGSIQSIQSIVVVSTFLIHLPRLALARLGFPTTLGEIPQSRQKVPWQAWSVCAQTRQRQPSSAQQCPARPEGLHLTTPLPGRICISILA